MNPIVVWDASKSASNYAKHGVSFEEACLVFDDLPGQFYPDDRLSMEEDRYIGVGSTLNGRVLVVSYTIRGALTRLVSARPATRAESRRYMNVHELRDEAIEAKPMNKEELDPPEFDFDKAKPGFGFKPRLGPEHVHLDRDVRIIFHGDEEVNNALRKLMQEGRSPAPDLEKRRLAARSTASEARTQPRSRRRS